MFTITESWQVIDKWLAEHAPVTLAKLKGPVDPAELAAAETRIGQQFPAELVESLNCHNGTTDWTRVLPIAEPLSADQVVHWYELWMESATDHDGFATHPGNPEPRWNPQWIPFADENGNTQVIDTEKGHRFGTAYNYSHGHFDGFWGWPSLRAYLDEVARALTTGDVIRGQWGAYVIDKDNELWWDQAGETTIGKGKRKRKLLPAATLGGAAGDQA